MALPSIARGSATSRSSQSFVLGWLLVLGNIARKVSVATQPKNLMNLLVNGSGLRLSYEDDAYAPDH